MAPAGGLIHTQPVSMKAGATLQVGSRQMPLKLPPKMAASRPGAELKIWDMEKSQRLVSEAREMPQAQHEGRLSKLDEAIVLDPHNPEAHEERAATLREAGRHEEAAEAARHTAALRLGEDPQVTPSGGAEKSPADPPGGWTEGSAAASSAVPDSTLKVMQAAVMVAALEAARAPEEAGEVLAGLSELGREAEGGVEALVEAGCLPAVQKAVAAHGHPPALSFLALDLVRLVTRGSRGENAEVYRGALTVAVACRPLPRDAACSLCMVAHNVARWPAGRAVLAGIQLDDLLLEALAAYTEDAMVVQYCLSALVSFWCMSAAQDSSLGGATPLSCRGLVQAAILAAAEHPGEVPVQLEALRAITLAAQGEVPKVEAELWRRAHGLVTAAMEVHMDEDGSSQLAGAALAALGGLSRQLGSMRESDVTACLAGLEVLLRDRCLTSHAGGAVEALQLLTAGVSSGAAGDRTGAATAIVVRVLEAAEGRPELATATLVALSRMMRHPAGRDAAVVSRVVRVVAGAMEAQLSSPQLQGHGLRVLMEVAQASPQEAVAQHGAWAAARALVAHRGHSGLVKDAIFALFLMEGGLAEARRDWDEATSVALIEALDAVVASQEDDDDMARRDARAVRGALAGGA